MFWTIWLLPEIIIYLSSKKGCYGPIKSNEFYGANEDEYLQIEELRKKTIFTNNFRGLGNKPNYLQSQLFINLTI